MFRSISSKSKVLSILMVIFVACIVFSIQAKTVVAQEHTALLFEENFEDGKIDGQHEWGIWGQGSVGIINDEGNKVLSLSARESGEVNINFGSDSWEDYTIKTRFKRINWKAMNFQVGIRFREKRDQSYNFDFNKDNVWLGKWTGGWKHITDKRYYFSTGKWYNFKIELKENNIKTYINDKLIFDITDTDNPLTSGHFKFVANRDTTVYFDDIQVFMSPGSIIATSTPVGADIYLDGQWRGKTPLTLPDLDLLRHDLRFSKEGYEDCEKIVVASSGKTKTINCDLQEMHGTIKITSDPRAAAVTFNGKDVGTTPLTMSDLSLGSYKIGFRRFGYEDCEKSITLIDERVQDVSCALKAIAERKPTTTPPPVIMYVCSNHEIVSNPGDCPKGTTASPIPVSATTTPKPKETEPPINFETSPRTPVFSVARMLWAKMPMSVKLPFLFLGVLIVLTALLVVIPRVRDRKPAPVAEEKIRPKPVIKPMFLPPSISVKRTLERNPIKIGETVKVLVSVANKGKGPAESISVSDKIPRGLTLDSGFPKWQGRLDGIEGKRSSIMGSRKEKTKTFSYTLKAEKEGEYTFDPIVVFYKDMEGDALEAKGPGVTIRVVKPLPPPELQADRSLSRTTINEGEKIMARVKIENKGLGPARSISISEKLPKGVKVISGNASWKGGLGPGESRVLEYTIKADKEGRFAIPISVIKYKDSDGENFKVHVPSGSFEVQKIRKVSVELDFPKDLAYKGEEVRIYVKVENRGTHAIEDAVITARFPGALNVDNEEIGIGFLSPSDKYNGYWSIKPKASGKFTIYKPTFTYKEERGKKKHRTLKSLSVVVKEEKRRKAAATTVRSKRGSKALISPWCPKCEKYKGRQKECQHCGHVEETK